MFTGHAKFPGVQDLKFKRAEPRQVAPHWPAATHANDSLRGRRRAAGRRRSPSLILACYWVLTEANRIECRWNVEEPDSRSLPDTMIHTAAAPTRSAVVPG